MATTDKPRIFDPVAETEQARAIAARYRCEYVDLREAAIDHDLFRSIPVDLMFRYNFVPMTSSEASALVLTELTALAKESGIKMGQAQFSREEVEGSNSLVMQSWQVGFEGTYANFAKFVNLVDKSQRFLIIENMSAAAPQQQGGQSLNVTLKIDSFIRDAAGELL